MSVLDYFFSSSTQDFVGVFDANFNQVFTKARILKPVVKPSAKGMEHPLESGKTVTDHVIIEPLQLDLTMIITGFDLSNTYEEIFNYFHNFTLFTVQTKTTNYSNLYILEMPHEESPDQFDAVSIVLSFKQALIATSGTSTIVPKNPIDSDTINRGTQTPLPNDSQSTILLNSARALFSGF
jgi:hypothetical protein